MRYLSHETSTHFKWYIFRHPVIDYSVWVHQYKTQEPRVRAFADVPHTHRYWFTSVVLAGGFTHGTFALPIRDRADHFRQLAAVEERTYRAGDVYTLEAGAIHALSHMADPTVTLIVRSPASLPFSESFRIETGSITKHYGYSSLVRAWPKLIKG
jgi:hypothetical protein